MSTETESRFENAYLLLDCIQSAPSIPRTKLVRLIQSCPSLFTSATIVPVPDLLATVTETEDEDQTEQDRSDEEVSLPAVQDSITSALDQSRLHYSY